MSSANNSSEPEMHSYFFANDLTSINPACSHRQTRADSNTKKGTISRLPSFSSSCLGSDVSLSPSQTAQILHSILPKLDRWRLLIFYISFYRIRGHSSDAPSESKLEIHTSDRNIRAAQNCVRSKASEIAEEVRSVLWQAVVSSAQAEDGYTSTPCSTEIDTSFDEDVFVDADVLALIRHMYESYRTERAKMSRRCGIAFQTTGDTGGWVRKLGLEVPPVSKVLEEVSVQTTIPVRQFIRAWELYVKNLELKCKWNKLAMVSEQKLHRRRLNRYILCETLVLDRLSVVPMLTRWMGYVCLANTLIEDRKDIESCSAFDQEASDQSRYSMKDPRDVYLNAIRRCKHRYFEVLEETYAIGSSRFHFRMGRTLKIKILEEELNGAKQEMYLYGYRDDRTEGLTAWLRTIRL